MKTQVKFIENIGGAGGVTAPQGFTANGVLCRIKESRKQPDLALIYSERQCSAAGVFTQNRVKAECVKLTQAHLADGKAQAVIANSGNANACTGTQGYETAKRMAFLAANALGIAAEEVLVCSTGVIGQQLPVSKIEENIAALSSGLSKNGHENARLAIMTTDTRHKEAAVQFEIGGKTVTVGAMCKGSGMIHINMGTMLAFATTDCAITAQMLEKALKRAVTTTFNCVSVDGDTSTNDSLTILANGLAGNDEICSEGEPFEIFTDALEQLFCVLAKKIAADGEGASRLVECSVKGAVSGEVARGLAKEVISSNLVKAAMFGKDANWGRILCALGYSGYEFVQEKTSVFFMSRQGEKRYDSCGKESGGELKKICVFENGVPLKFDEDVAKQILSEEVVCIEVHLEDGEGCGKAWGCDLTYDYVKINGDYRT